MTVEQAESIDMPFGKHRGKSLGDIAESDVLYLDWLVGQDWLRGDLKGAVGLLCEKHARRIQDEVDR